MRKSRYALVASIPALTYAYFAFLPGGSQEANTAWTQDKHGRIVFTKHTSHLESLIQAAPNVTLQSGNAALSSYQSVIQWFQGLTWLGAVWYQENVAWTNLVAAQAAQTTTQNEANSSVSQTTPVASYTEAPTSNPAPSNTSSTSSGSYNAPGGYLSCVAQAESQGNPTIYNTQGSGASGLYQFEPGTWDNYDGYANAADAPPSVQTQKAEEVYAANGSAPWAGDGC